MAGPQLTHAAFSLADEQDWMYILTSKIWRRRNANQRNNKDVIEGAGITTYCENLAEGLNDAGHEVILLAGSTSHYPS